MTGNEDDLDDFLANFTIGSEAHLGERATTNSIIDREEKLGAVKCDTKRYDQGDRSEYISTIIEVLWHIQDASSHEPLKDREAGG